MVGLRYGVGFLCVYLSTLRNSGHILRQPQFSQLNFTSIFGFLKTKLMEIFTPHGREYFPSIWFLKIEKWARKLAAKIGIAIKYVLSFSVCFLILLWGPLSMFSWGTPLYFTLSWGKYVNFYLKI